MPPSATFFCFLNAMVKPSRSRTSLFSQWRFDTSINTTHNDKSINLSSPSTSDSYSPRETTFSPSTTTSTPFASPSSYLSSDPFRYSLALPAPYTSTSTSPYYHEALSGNDSPYGGIAEDDEDDHQQHHAHNRKQNQVQGHSQCLRTDPSGYQAQDQNRYSPNPNAVKSTESLVSGTATTPKITLASPSTTTIHHYLFPDPAEKTQSNLDPSAARKIARSISKRQLASAREEREETAEEEERLVERKRLESAFPDPPKEKPLRPARRVVSPSNLNIILNTAESEEDSKSGSVVRKDEKHPLSMRTLRRQPSMADLGNQNKKLALGEPIELQSDTRPGREVSDNKPVGQSKQVAAGWKGTLKRRESEAWRELVGSSGWDTVSVVTDTTREWLCTMVLIL